MARAGADVACVCLQDADDGAVGALASALDLEVVSAQRAGALRVVVLARQHVRATVTKSAQAQIPGADPDRHGLLAARVDVRAGKGCENPNFKGSYLGRFPLVSADF